MLLKQPFPRAQRPCPDLTWVVQLLCSMTRFWWNFSFLSPLSSWSTWHPGSSWVSGKCWYLSNSTFVWNDTCTCGKRNPDDHHIRWQLCTGNPKYTKAQAHIFPLEPKGVMPAAKFPLEQSNTIKEKTTAISYESSTQRWSVKVSSWSLNHRGETVSSKPKVFSSWGYKYHIPKAVLDIKILFLPTHAELRCECLHVKMNTAKWEAHFKNATVTHSLQVT